MKRLYRYRRLQLTIADVARIRFITVATADRCEQPNRDWANVDKRAHQYDPANHQPPPNSERKIGAFIDYFRWNLGIRLLQREYVLPLIGDARVIVSDRQNYATLLYTCCLWDFPEMMFLAHVLRPSDLFVDIGANVGVYTVLASAVTGARSIAFEPIPTTYEELNRNIALNNIGDRVETRRVCLGSSNGTVRMTANQGGLNHVAMDQDGDATVETQVMRLDDALGAVPCQFIKIDAEGYEAEIFSGAATVLGNPELLGLIVELNDAGLRYGHTNEAVHEMLTGYGFGPFHYDARMRSLRPLPTFNANSLNTLYLRDTTKVMDRIATAPAVSVRGQAI